MTKYMWMAAAFVGLLGAFLSLIASLLVAELVAAPPDTNAVCAQMKQFNRPSDLADWIGHQDHSLLSEVLACTYFRKGLGDWLDERAPEIRPEERVGQS